MKTFGQYMIYAGVIVLMTGGPQLLAVLQHGGVGDLGFLLLVYGGIGSVLIGLGNRLMKESGDSSTTVDAGKQSDKLGE